MPARLLVVEDTPHNMQLMTYLLEAQGHTVVPAEDGKAAFDLADASPPDLVIMDLQLPDLTGEEVMAVLRRRPAMAGVPFVAVTALAMVGDRDRVLAAGFDAYLTKPLDPRTFARDIERHLPEPLRGTAPVVATDVPVAPAPVAPTSGPRVLVVDDRPTNVELMRSILGPSGYRVDGAVTVTEGIEQARAERPDLILSDLHLVGEDGFDFYAALQADPALADIPFAFMSASAPSTSEAAQDAAALAYFIARPMEPQGVLDEVERLLDRGRA